MRFFKEEIRALRERELMLLNSTGLEAPNFHNAQALQHWIQWDGEFDSMQKDRLLFLEKQRYAIIYNISGYIKGTV